MMGLRLTDFEPSKAKKKRYAELVSSVVYMVVLDPTKPETSERSLDSGDRSGAIKM
jgi:hypothetical protein